MSEQLTIINNAFEKVQERFISLTDKATFDREKSFAIQIFRKSEALQKANLHSTLEAIMNVANIGLSLNPALKLAYLVPRFSKAGVEVCLEPSYQGLVKLVTDSGSAKNLYAHIVYDDDLFEETLGTEIFIKHVPTRKSKVVRLVYAVAVLHDGSKQVEVMTAGEIEEIRERSESYKAFKSGRVQSCVWASDFNEMSRKTVIRRLCKYLPKTEMWDKLSAAIQLDEKDYVVSDNQIHYIGILLRSAAIDHDEKERIEKQMHNYTASEAREIIDRLYENQLDPITSGQNYSQTDIKDKFKKIK